MLNENEISHHYDSTDQIRNYLDGLQIQDSKHELSKSPATLPLHWDPNKYPSILAAVLNPDLKVPTSAQQARLKPTIPQLENDVSRLGSDSSSRASSIACSSSFSSAGRSGSVSTASSLSSIRVPVSYSRPEKPDLPSDGSSRFPRPFLFPTSDREPLYEDHIKPKKCQVLVKNVNGRKAFRDHQLMKRERREWVEDDLVKEKGQIKTEDVERQQAFREKEAKSHDEQYRFSSICTQVSPDVQDTPMLKSGEEKISWRDPTGVSRATATGNFDICPRSQTGRPFQHEIKHSSSTTSSQLGSPTDSASSDDATDWEDNSEVEDYPENLHFRVPNHLFGEPGEASIFQTNLSPVKSRLIDKLMLDFWAIFDNTWSHGMRQHGSPSQSTSSTTISESGATPQSSSARYGKRCRSGDGEDGDNDEHRERRRKRSPEEKSLAMESEDPLVGQLACPFRKHNPQKYSIHEWPRCVLKPQKTIARLKAHLYQYHLIEQCPRCKSVFESEEMLEAHNMDQERCEARPDGQVEGMTRKMKDQIQCRRKPHPGQTDAEKWNQVYKIIFPGEAVPGPYFEPIPNSNITRPQSPDSVNLSHYESYLRRVLPGYIQNALSTAINTSLQPIESQLQRQMMDIIQEAQNQAFLSFRDTYTRSLQTNSVGDEDSAIDKDRKTSIETFFQPLPPVSFTGFEDMRRGQGNGGMGSDSGYASYPALSTTNSQHTSSEILEHDTSSNCDQDQGETTPSIGIGSAALDKGVTPMLGFEGMCGTGSGWLERPSGPRNSKVDSCFNGESSGQWIRKTEDMNENANSQGQWYEGLEIMERNYFDWDNERGWKYDG